MAKSYGNPFPKLPAVPRVPRAGKGRKPSTGLSPLAGPDIKLPGDQEESRQQRWTAFRQREAASYPEFIAYEWLTLKKKQVPHVDFEFQYPFLGGRTFFGGFVLDFYFPGRNMAWFVQGLLYHWTKTTDRARDILAKTLVANRGILVIELFEDDLIEREEYTLGLAWTGRQVGGRERL